MKTLLISLLICLSPGAFAFNQQDFEKANDLFMQAVKGEDNAREKAEALFEQMQKQDNDPLIRVFLGSLETLHGRDAWFPWSKLGYTEEGAEIIEKAVDEIDEDDFQDEKISYLGNAEWKSLIIRSIAAHTWSNLPFFFNRGEDAREQIELMLRSDKFKQSSKGFQQEIIKLKQKVNNQEAK